MRRTALFSCVVCLLLFSIALPIRAADDLLVLIKQLKDKDEVVRLKAAKALGKLGVEGREALPDLRIAVEDKDPDVRAVAKQAIKNIQDAVVAAERKGKLPVLEQNIKDAKSDSAKTRAAGIAGLAKQVRDPDDVIRLKAVQTLVELGTDAADALPALVDASKSDDEAVRPLAKKAVETIQLAASKKVHAKIDPLVKELRSKDKAARLKALDALADLGPDAKEAGQAIVEAMLDKSPAIAAKAGETLEKIDPEIHKHVITIALDQDVRAREGAIDSVAKLGPEGKAAVPVLFVVGQDRNLASPALQALAKVAPDDPRLIDAILRALHVPQAEIAKGEQHITNSALRTTAVSVLEYVSIPPDKAVRALVSALNDPRVRVEAIKALGRMGPKAEEAVPALTKLKQDPSAEVREAAASALEKIEGK